MPDEEFVTQAECGKTHAQILLDFGTFKKALVGDDFRGGIVKDVADTKKDIAEIKTALNNNGGNGGNNGGLGRKERAMLYVALITSLSGTSGIIVVEIIRNFH